MGVNEILGKESLDTGAAYAKAKVLRSMHDMNEEQQDGQGKSRI